MSHPKPSNKLANYPGRVDAPSLNSNNNTFNIFPFFPLRSAKSVWLQGDTSGWGLYFVDINLGSYPGLLGQYIAAVAAHKPGELPKQNMTKSHDRCDGKLSRDGEKSRVIPAVPWWPKTEAFGRCTDWPLGVLRAVVSLESTLQCNVSHNQLCGMPSNILNFQMWTVG